MQLLSSGSPAEMQLSFCAEWFEGRAKEAKARADAERLRNLGPAFPEPPKILPGGIASSGGRLLQLLRRVGTSTRRSGSSAPISGPHRRWLLRCWIFAAFIL